MRSGRPAAVASEVVVGRFQEHPNTDDRNEWPRESRGGPISCSHQVLKLLDEAARIARSEISALVCGESGTGKELLARHIHESSPRAGGPFVALNCAGLPRDLVEAELFGVERGAATGVDGRPGKFELADGGTILLDEIGDMSPQTQAMILRLLEDGAVTRVGSTKARHISVRVIAATNRNLDRMMKIGEFRRDLYYRIASWTCLLPPLRERKEDIPHLAAHFVSSARDIASKLHEGIAPDAMAVLVEFDWPGNIRQLKNEIYRAAALASGGSHIAIEHLSPVVGPTSSAGKGGTLRERLQLVERQIIEKEIEVCARDLGAVASRLGVPLSTLYRKIKVLGIRR